MLALDNHDQKIYLSSSNTVAFCLSHTSPLRWFTSQLTTVTWTMLTLDINDLKNIDKNIDKICGDKIFLDS